MKVSQLIEILKKAPLDAEIWVNKSNSHDTYHEKLEVDGIVTEEREVLFYRRPHPVKGDVIIWSTSFFDPY